MLLAGPVPDQSGATGELIRINQAMRKAARAHRVRYLDAIELGWKAQQDLTARMAEQLLVVQRPRSFAPVPSDPLPSAIPTPTATRTR